MFVLPLFVFPIIDAFLGCDRQKTLFVIVLNFFSNYLIKINYSHIYLNHFKKYL